MFIKALGDELVSKLTTPSLAIGTTLWFDYIPETPHTIVVLSTYTADQPELVFGKGVPLVRHPRIQVMSRGEMSAAVEAYTSADAVFKHLCGLVDKTITTTMGAATVSYTATMIPLNEPTLAGRDAQERPIYTCNFQATVS